MPSRPTPCRDGRNGWLTPIQLPPNGFRCRLRPSNRHDRQSTPPTSTSQRWLRECLLRTQSLRRTMWWSRAQAWFHRPTQSQIHGSRAWHRTRWNSHSQPKQNAHHRIEDRSLTEKFAVCWIQGSRRMNFLKLTKPQVGRGRCRANLLGNACRTWNRSFPDLGAFASSRFHRYRRIPSWTRRPRCRCRNLGLGCRCRFRLRQSRRNTDDSWRCAPPKLRRFFGRRRCRCILRQKARCHRNQGKPRCRPERCPSQGHDGSLLERLNRRCSGSPTGYQTGAHRR